jgi:hypothetical protein
MKEPPPSSGLMKVTGRMDSGSCAGCLNPKVSSAAWRASSDAKGMYITRGESIRASGEGRGKEMGLGLGLGGGWRVYRSGVIYYMPRHAPIQSSAHGEWGERLRATMGQTCKCSSF